MRIVIDMDEKVYNDFKDAYKRGYCGRMIDLDIIINGTILPKEYNGKNNVLDKIKGYVDHIRNTGMGKKKSLEFIEKFIEGLKAESEGE